MKPILALCVLALLAGCDPAGNPRPDPEPKPSGSGISISGYGQVGVSTGG